MRKKLLALFFQKFRDVLRQAEFSYQRFQLRLHVNTIYDLLLLPILTP